MRTRIEIDDNLLRQAMKSTGASAEAAIEAGLRLLVKVHSQVAIRELRGKVKWEGDLNRSRLGHVKE